MLRLHASTLILQAAGTAKPSFATLLLQEYANNLESSAEDYDDIKAVCGVIYAGQIDMRVQSSSDLTYEHLS